MASIVWRHTAPTTPNRQRNCCRKNSTLPCRPWALGSMISMEAAREGGRSNFWLVFLKNHTVKSHQIYIRVQASSALLSTPWRIAEKIVIRCSGPLEWFSNRCPMLKNSQVESFCRAPIASHWAAEWVVLSLVQFRLGTTQQVQLKIGYHITLMRISSSFWRENKTHVHGCVCACPA